MSATRRAMAIAVMLRVKICCAAVWLLVPAGGRLALHAT